MAVRKRKVKRVKPIALPTPGGMSERAREALKHLEQGWVPVNEDLLLGIQANLKNNHYEGSPEALIEDLKKDPGLFFTVTKRLKPFAPIDTLGFDPFSLLSELEDEQLEQVFNFDPGAYSRHRTWDASPSQELVHTVSRLGGESAESLAEEVGLSPENAHEGALFRQFGYQLLAWNYPKLFAQALSAHRTKGLDFDKQLEEYFGVRPTQLGARFARELEMSRDIKRSLINAPDRQLQPGQDIKNVFQLTHVCQLSDIFAKANEPEFFPEAKIEWEAKENVLRPVLGDEVFDDLHIQAEEIVEEEVQATDFGDLGEYVASVDKSEVRIVEIPKTNPHLTKCSEEIQSAFLEIYRELDRSKKALDAIRVLLSKAAPATGIVRGCLFLQRKTDFSLQAALRFGETPLTKYQKFLYNGRNGIVESIHSIAPYTREGTGVTGEQTFQVCGGLGGDGPPGVLYLEVDESLKKDPNYNPLVMFHIIKNSLQDCLKQLEEDDKTRMSFY